MNLQLSIPFVVKFLLSLVRLHSERRRDSPHVQFQQSCFDVCATVCSCAGVI